LLGNKEHLVNWTDDDKELLFLGSSPRVYGLWNGYGKKLGLLPEKQGQIIFADVIGDPRDEILIFADRTLSIFTPRSPGAKSDIEDWLVRLPPIQTGK
jgi:hypothetical protein